jgi:hypothetical protein
VTEIPIFNQEFSQSVLAVMLFPDDVNKARAWASRRLASGPIEAHFRAGHTLAPAELVALMQSAGADFSLVHEAKQSFEEGRAVGKIVGHLVRAIDSDGAKASWSKSIKYAGPRHETSGKPLTRATVANYRAHTKRVLHLWGAYNLAGGQPFSHEAPSGLEAVYEFLYESELVLSTLKRWAAGNKQLQNNLGHLDADHYRAPAWAEPSQKPVQAPLGR